MFKSVFLRGLCSSVIAVAHQQSVVMALTDTLSQHPHLTLAIKSRSARFTCGRRSQAFKTDVGFRDRRTDGAQSNLREDLERSSRAEEAR